MSETSISKKEFGLFCVLLQLFHFIFFLLSHPLYFSYFIFFFPYFLKLLSFLSPLFITTSLLLFAFFLFLSSSSDLHSVPQFADNSKMGFLTTNFQVVFDRLRQRTPDEIDEFRSVEVLEAYKIVFETYNFGAEQNPYGGEDSEFNVPEVEVTVDCEESVENFPGKILDVEVDCEESMENFPGKILEMEVNWEESVEYFPGKILDVEVDCKEPLEIFPGKILDVKIDCEEYLENPLLYENVAEIEPKTEELEEAKIEKKEEIRDSWKAIESEMKKDLKKLREESSISSRSESSLWSSPGSLSREYNSLGSYGSMMKEKEWRRTLACKLFEDRHNSEGTEGMDSLWETYEKIESKKLQKINGRSKRGKKTEDEEDEDEDENGERKLCCLQALKFSARKMNLGMGRPNLVKMSKALKKFGLFRKRSLIR